MCFCQNVSGVYGIILFLEDDQFPFLTGHNRAGAKPYSKPFQIVAVECFCYWTDFLLASNKITLCCLFAPIKCIKQPISLRIQPPLIRSRYYVRNAKTVYLRFSHVIAGANERLLYSQTSSLSKLCVSMANNFTGNTINKLRIFHLLRSCFWIVFVITIMLLYRGSVPYITVILVGVKDIVC